MHTHRPVAHMHTHRSIAYMHTHRPMAHMYTHRPVAHSQAKQSSEGDVSEHCALEAVLSERACVSMGKPCNENYQTLLFPSSVILHCQLTLVSRCPCDCGDDRFPESMHRSCTLHGDLHFFLSFLMESRRTAWHTETG